MAIATESSVFASDTLRGLSSPRKYLLSKYLYDDKGSMIFRKIMHMPEYYLTRSEQEIFNEQSEDIARYIHQDSSFFRLIELGPGDGLKSEILLKSLLEKKAQFSYMPVDISRHAINILINNLHKQFNGILIEEQTGDYFQVLRENQTFSEDIRKVILFVGGNIGNFSNAELHDFLNLIDSVTNKGDMLLIGFDLKKDPDIILKAYDDPAGITRDFNLNHLERINRELGADFNLKDFRHYCCYNPSSGYAKSFLVCQRHLKVKLRELDRHISFSPWESIFMELSRKVNLNEIQHLAQSHGFEVKKNFTDSRGYFTDSLWIKK